MPTTIGIGYSRSADPGIAAKEAAVMAKAQTNAAHTDLVIIFGTMGYQHPEVFRVIRPILQPKLTLGSSTSGVILADTILAKGIGVMAIVSDEIIFNGALEKENPGDNINTIGQQFGQSLVNNSPGINRHGLLYFADPHFKNQTDLINGIQSSIGIAFPLIGAVSSDPFTFTHAFQIYEQFFSKQSVCGAFISGQATVATDLKHGWNPLGKPRIVTASTNNIIHTIDNKPAIHIYQEFFGDDARQIETEKMNNMTILYPLGVYHETQEQYLIRSPIDFMEDGSIVCQGEVPINTELHLMIGNKDSLKEAAQEAATQVKQNLHGRQAKFIIIVASAIRQKLFGRSANQEIQLIREILGYTTPIFGMYTYGEISALTSPGNIRQLHFTNGSMAVMAIG